MERYFLILLGVTSQIIPNAHSISLTSILSKYGPETFAPLNAIPLNSNPQIEHRRQLVIDMTKQLWNANSVALKSDLRSLLPAMSTLWLMGLREEFGQAKQFLEAEMMMADDQKLFTRNLTLEAPGALLSVYVLTGEDLFLQNAQEFADAYQMPDLTVESDLTEILRSWISLRMEFRYLTDLTKDSKYWNQILVLEQFLGGIGLERLVQENVEFDYNFMIQVKSFIQSNRTDLSEILQYYQTIDSMQSTGRLESVDKFGLAQIRQPESHLMNQRHCSYGAMLSLGAVVMPQVSSSVKKARKHWDLAERIAETCHLASNASGIDLPFETFRLDENSPDAVRAIRGSGDGYWLEPEIAETYFVLYRLTGYEKYLDYAWQLVKPIYAQASQISHSGGLVYSSEESRVNPGQFFGATLKYLYLTFAPEDLLPLEEWVFNAQGQPLPICGKNPAYPKT